MPKIIHNHSYITDIKLNSKMDISCITAFIYVESSNNDRDNEKIWYRFVLLITLTLAVCMIHA